jgi:hypothetical protein
MSLPDEIKERTGVISDLLAMVSLISELPTPPLPLTQICEGKGRPLKSLQQQGMTGRATPCPIEKIGEPMSISLAKTFHMETRGR